MRLAGMGFWQRVNKTDGCWLWVGSKTSAGYGDLHFMGKHVLAHRVAYTLEHGEIPTGRLVLHKCDTPLCVRPDHLFTGTDADNHADMLAKDRDNTRGEKNIHAKLTAADVVEIRKLKGTMKQKEIAARYGINFCHVGSILNRRAWKHVP